MTEITAQERYWVWLSSLEGIGPVRFYDVLNAFTDLENAWNHVGEIEKRVPRIGPKISALLKKCRNDFYVDQILEQCQRSGIRIITRLGRQYPQILSEIENPPPVLYYKGTLPDMEERTCGIVGTRRPTRKGFETAKQISSGLAAQGVVIVSGMARGIDTAAHMGALAAGGFTVAVLGCGADIVYPAENKDLYEEIIQKGAVLSEFLPGSQPRATNFPQRNRIVSGLSKALIAGEGGDKSGARITVDDALSQGRDVYAMACDLKSPVASLPLYLMESGAPVISSAAEVMDAQGWAMDFGITQTNMQKETNKLDLFQSRIYNLLLKESLTTEQLAQALECPVHEVSAVLTILELNGLIASAPGDKFRINT
ncbi:MAG: DNA-processing protein DprA [Christensenella sp.]|nr:DNA-processing protein DprA [Christensenella sp.]